MGKWIHRLSNIDEQNKTAYCAHCGKVNIKYRPKQNLWMCQISWLENKRKYSKYNRGVMLKYLYGITYAEYEFMLEEQEGKCWICKKRQSTKRQLSVDHNHKTGKVRRLLCHECNVVLGLVEEDTDRLETMITYLHTFH